MLLNVVILAAGQGKRMRSALPKVLHRLGGKPLLEHACLAARDLQPEQIYVVYGHAGEQVRDALGYLGVRWVEQDRQLGTGHAVAQVLPFIGTGATVLVLYGDVPLITPETLDRLVKASHGGRLSLLTVELPDPSGYGRIVRDADAHVQRIVEDRDASPAERAICEVNTGMMAVSAALLKPWVARLENRNVQGEYYLTDVIAMAVAEGAAVEPVGPASVFEVMGVNDRVQLAELERHYQRCQAKQLMRQGVTLLDPGRFDLRGELQTGQDVVIDVNVVLEGRVRLGDRVTIGPNNYLRDADIGDDAAILPNCVIEGAEIGRGARVGPFSRLRPETRLAEAVHVGNFVEVKKSSVQSGTKINHLSYIGDAEIGRDTNIGAGTITCNYDGANKHKTLIGEGVFIGSDTQLIAPVKVGDGATIGAGTTLAQDAPPGQLTLGRARQTTIAGWERPTKKK
ncbi:MAG: bifunctional UDP-N-acetylglucosamine diphosphorylase/glucosamine-1-phosphate N-acetyltransferase GlmU [Gammaproteobacteria bacterium]